MLSASPIGAEVASEYMHFRSTGTTAQTMALQIGTAIPGENPAGAKNSAPTVTGRTSLSVDEDCGSYLVSLHEIFDDAEDADSALRYEITGNTNPDLFADLNVDAAAGELVLMWKPGANGAASVTVTATDTTGASVSTGIHTDVGTVDDKPLVTNFVGYRNDDGTWTFRGEVDDPDPNNDDTEGWEVEFGGLVGRHSTRVDEDGEFQFIYTPDGYMDGYVTVQVTDDQGTTSDLISIFISDD